MKECLFFHKWKYIGQKYCDTFLGEDIEKYYIRFRECKKCGVIQERVRVDEFSWRWKYLEESETKILKNKLQSGGKVFYV